MGLNVLKWMYDLGVKHERNRIASYLSNMQSQRHSFISEMDRQYSSTKDATESQERKREIKYAVDQEVINIIATMFEPREVYTRGESSVIFPKEDK